MQQQMTVWEQVRGCCADYREPPVMLERKSCVDWSVKLCLQAGIEELYLKKTHKALTSLIMHPWNISSQMPQAGGCGTQ